MRMLWYWTPKYVPEATGEIFYENRRICLYNF